MKTDGPVDTKSMRVAIYARVSTEDQDCEIQLTNLRAFVKRWGWPAAIEYVEKLSGKEGGKRPQLEWLLEDVRDRKVDVVLVWKMDRFGRSTLDTLTNIKTLDYYRVRFLCPTMHIDTDDRSPTGKFTLKMFAAIALFGFNLLFGTTGLLSFGHAMFIGIGAYAAAVAAGPLGVRSFEMALLLAAIAAVMTDIDVVANNVVSSGQIAADLKLRDQTLPTDQAELDEFAQNLASRFDTEGLRLFTDPSGNVPTVSASPPVQSNYVGFAGIIQTLRLKASLPSLGLGLELEAIAAAVIGGCLLTGGVGSVVGAIIGALLIRSIDNGLIMARVDADYFKASISALTIIAVILNTYIRRRASNIRG